MSDSRMWSCPTCGRKFVNANQWHSCSLAEVSSHVAKSEPEIARVYHLLAERIVNLGSVEVQPMKTAIVFKAVTTFAGVQVRKRWLNLGLLLDDRLASPRFDRVTTLSPSTHEHRLRIASESEVDDELETWLRRAHRLGCRAAR